MIVIAAGDLLGRSAHGWNRENVRVAGLQNACAIRSPAQFGDNDGRVLPFRTRGFLGQADRKIVLRGDARRVANPFPVRRPGNVGGALL